MTGRSLRLRVFGTPDQLAAVEPGVSASMRMWAPIWQPPAAVDIRYFHTRPELHGHVLALGEAQVLDGQPPIQVAGCSTETRRAVDSCVGELVEREVARCWRAPDAVHASARELLATGRRVFAVDDYLGRPLFTDRWPYPPFRSDRHLAWAPARQYPDGEQIWVPESLIGMRKTPVAEQVGEVTTIGLAAGRTYREAALHALHELLERATLMRHWQTNRPLELLAGPAVAAHRELLDTDLALGWRTQLLQARTQIGTGVVLALTRRPDTRSFGVGISAAPDPEHRIRHALAEAMQVRLLASLHQGRTTDTINNFQDHVIYYCHPQRFAQLETLVGPPTEDLVGADTRSHEALAARLAEDGAQVVVAELGGHPAPSVTRVLSTRLPHMEVREDCARLSGTGATVSGAATGSYRPHPYP